MNDSAIPTRRPEVAWRVIEGEAVVVDPRAGITYPLNTVATRCWEMADGSRPVATIISAVIEEFDAPEEQIKQDVEGFIQDLQSKGLLELRS